VPTESRAARHGAVSPSNRAFHRATIARQIPMKPATARFAPRAPIVSPRQIAWTTPPRSRFAHRRAPGAQGCAQGWALGWHPRGFGVPQARSCGRRARH
jgi:hypothetical protein